MAERSGPGAVPAEGPSVPGARVAVRGTRAAHALYAAAVAGLGGLLLSGTFVYVWAPLPQWVPWRNAVACAFGALTLVSGALFLWRRTVVPSSATLALLFLSWLLLVQVPRIVGAPSKEILWAGAAQIATVVAGGWLRFASSSNAKGVGRSVGEARGVKMGRSLYAVALPLFGLHHFVALAGAAEAVPAWLPLRLGWAFLTGAGHVAAGAAILLQLVPRLAATLEAIMITSFVLLVHVPGVVNAPADRLQWTMLVVASAISGAAWIVAASFTAKRIFADRDNGLPPPTTE